MAVQRPFDAFASFGEPTDYRKELFSPAFPNRRAERGKRRGRKYPALSSLSHFHPLADRCAGFELFRQLPEVSQGRGVSRFMQNGTRLPGEVASNATFDPTV